MSCALPQLTKNIDDNIFVNLIGKNKKINFFKSRNVLTIGDSAFCYTQLTSVTFPGAVGTIADAAFYFCSSMTTLTFGGNIGSIGMVAFAYNTQLTSLTFPGTIGNVGDSAFLFCSSLTTVTFGGAVANFADDVFEGSGLTDVYYPSSWDIPKGKFPADVTFHAV